MPRTRVRYGVTRTQTADLWRPSGVESPPVVMLLHGGFWRSRYTKVLLAPLARAVVAQGWAAWNVEYRRVGRFGGGGGWPATFDDTRAALAHLATIDGLDLERVAVVGHSAGGLLALWLAAQPDPPVPVRIAISLAGVVELDVAAETCLGGGAVPALLGGMPAEVPERYTAASPLERLPCGVEQVLIHGLDDDVVPSSMSARYAERAATSGDTATYVPIDGAGHMQMIMPSGPGWRATVAHLEASLR